MCQKSLSDNFLAHRNSDNRTFPNYTTIIFHIKMIIGKLTVKI